MLNIYVCAISMIFFIVYLWLWIMKTKCQFDRGQQNSRLSRIVNFTEKKKESQKKKELEAKSCTLECQLKLAA